MSGLLTTGILQQIKNRVSGTYLLDGISGIALAYSKYKLLASATNSLRASNAALTEDDIPFDGNHWDISAIESNAAGGQATIATLYDQSGVYGPLTQGTKSLMPRITDASGNALSHIFNHSAGGVSLVNDNTANLPALTDDYVCSFVMAYDTGQIAARSTFNIRKSSTANINLVVFKSGSTYLIEYIENSALSNTVFTHGYVYTPSSISDTFVITLIRTSGIVTLYINGTAVTWGSGTLTGSLSVATGVLIGRRVSSTVQSRVFEYQTLLLFTGADLSSFDISTFNTNIKALHGIS